MYFLIEISLNSSSTLCSRPGHSGASYEFAIYVRVEPTTEAMQDMPCNLGPYGLRPNGLLYCYERQMQNGIYNFVYNIMVSCKSMSGADQAAQSINMR